MYTLCVYSLDNLVCNFLKNATIAIKKTAPNCNYGEEEFYIHNPKKVNNILVENRILVKCNTHS